MTLEELKSYINQELTGLFPEEEIAAFLYRLLEDKMQLQRIDLVLKSQMQITSEEQQFFETAISRLKNEEPIQYILGTTSFYGLEFNLNNKVLIPRPETEELVDWIINDAKRKKPKLIVDIGTGSGCIAVSLAVHIKETTIHAFDVSEQAIQMASQNAKKNNVDVQFEKINILNTINYHEKFDVIVSNPPYVRMLEKEEIQKNVLSYEPHLALFVDDHDALLFYRKICEFANTNLNLGGVLYFEINQYLGKETEALVSSFGYEVELKKDLFGNDRMLKAWKN